MNDTCLAVPPRLGDEVDVTCVDHAGQQRNHTRAHSVPPPQSGTEPSLSHRAVTGASRSIETCSAARSFPRLRGNLAYLNGSRPQAPRPRSRRTRHVLISGTGPVQHGMQCRGVIQVQWGGGAIPCWQRKKRVGCVCVCVCVWRGCLISL